MSQRIALGISYHGKNYRGWQAQAPGIPTIQTCLEQAIARVANHPIQLHCAGRTDAGVHALGQVAHFDTCAVRPLSAWVYGVNTQLPPDIRVNWAQPLAAEFHARFAATARSYRYYIYNASVCSALFHAHTTWHYKNLDAAVMHQAAQTLLGEHDFSAFRGSACQSTTPIRTVQQVQVQRHGALVYLDITANAFLHHMVRNIMGTLLLIGSGERPTAWLGQVLATADRKQAAQIAPPQGLYLMTVTYPPQYAIPAKLERSLFAPLL